MILHRAPQVANRRVDHRERTGAFGLTFLLLLLRLLLRLRLEIELLIVRLIELLKLLHPLLAGVCRREAPLLAMVVPVVGVELLRVLEVRRRQIVAPGLMEPYGQLEAGVGFLFRGGTRFDAPRKFVIRQRVRTPLPVRNPVLQRRHIRGALDDERLAANRVGAALGPGWLGGPDHASALVDPHAHRHVDELEGRADRVLHVNKRREGRLRGVVPATGDGFSRGVLRRGDDLEILRFQLVVQFLPTWQIEAAASPGRPGDHEHLFPAEVGQADGAAVTIRHSELRRHARLDERPA
jgi:hypothetical protein